MAYKLKIAFNVVLLILHLASRVYLVVGSSIGVCYGLEGDDLPAPKEVVFMYKAHGIKRMRLYEPNDIVLESLRGSGIEVIIGIKNEHIESLARSPRLVGKWIERNIVYYWPAVRFRYIAIGNEAIPGPYAHHVLPAMQYMYTALVRYDLWHHIKVSTVITTSVMDVLHPPSAATFSTLSLQYMKPIAQQLAVTRAPLLANIYPYFLHLRDPARFTLDYALFNSQSKLGPIRNDNLVYTNLFDEMVDALHVSMKKVGYQVSVVVSETGWPSAGNSSKSTQAYARIYIPNVIRHVSSHHGTPKMEGRIETYLYAMFTENNKPSRNREQWGLYFPNKKPVLGNISFNI